MLGTPKALGAELRARKSPEARPRPGELDGKEAHRERTRETMADSREVMNIRQASQYLGVSPDTFYKYVGEQKIPAFKLGNRWRFKKSTVGPVDGREVERDGTAQESETQTEGFQQMAERPEGSTCGQNAAPHKKVGTCLDSDRSPLLAWMWAPRALRQWS